MSTTAFAVRRALLDALKDDATLQALTIGGEGDVVTIGYSDEMGAYPRLAIEINDVNWSDTSATSLGAGHYNEKYDIKLLLHSHVDGDDQDTADQRVEDMADAVEALVTDPRWSNVAGVYGSGCTPQYYSAGVDSGGRGAMYLIHVTISART